MANQLDHLIQLASHDLIVRIVPFTADITRLILAFWLATVDSGKQVAFLESALRGHITEQPSDVAELRRVWAQTGAESLSPQASIDLIQETIKDRWFER